MNRKLNLPARGTQVITIDLDGSITGLDHKKKGLDLRQFGKADIKRVTLIEWNEQQQKWFIHWCRVPKTREELVAVYWTRETFDSAGVSAADFNGDDTTAAVTFDDYEDAVAAEVAVIQAMQKQGADVHA